jgi:P-type E1-E2 ATPase
MVNHLGKGLVAAHAGQTIEVGTPELFAALGLAPPPAAIEKVEAFAGDAKTAMIVHRGAAWGVIAAADQVRPTAADTVRTLRTLGIRRLAVLSGDNEHTVEAIARRTGVDEQHGRLLPEDKVRVIADLERTHGPVAMIGDGVNDAPSLAQSDLGIALGSGADIAMEAAPLVLMHSSLGAVTETLDLARRAFSIVRQNLFWAFAYNIIGITLAVLGILTPILAAGAMVLSSLSVIGNSRRLG